MEKDQIIKALEWWTKNFDGKVTDFKTLCEATLHIKSQDGQIFQLENRLKECENGYAGTLHLESCKLHDAEERVRELTEEVSRLQSQVTRLKKSGDERILAFTARLIDNTKADTVREFAERFKARIKGIYLDESEASAIIDQVAEEVLDGKTEGEADG